MKFTELTLEEFFNFTLNYPVKNVYQTTSYGSTMNGQGYVSYYVGVRDETGKILCATLMMVKRTKGFKYATCPRGPLIDFQNKELVTAFTEGLKGYCKANNIIAVKINPLLIKNVYDIKERMIINNPDYQGQFDNIIANGYFHLGYNNYFEGLKPRFDAILNMDKDVTDIFMGFGKETKTKVRSAISKGVEIIRGDNSDLGIMYDLVKKKYPRDSRYLDDLYAYFDKSGSIELYYAKLNMHVYLKHTQNEYNQFMLEAQKYNELIIKKGNKGTNSLVNKKLAADKKFERAKRNIEMANNLTQVKSDGIILAAMLVIKNGHTIYSIIDGMNPKFKSFNAKHLLIWSVIEKYAKQGVTDFDLGGCTNPRLKENKYEGLNIFKTNFGANIYEYAGDFELIINKPMYFMYTNSLDEKK